MACHGMPWHVMAYHSMGPISTIILHCWLPQNAHTPFFPSSFGGIPHPERVWLLHDQGHALRLVVVVPHHSAIAALLELALVQKQRQFRRSVCWSDVELFAQGETPIHGPEVDRLYKARRRFLGATRHPTSAKELDTLRESRAKMAMARIVFASASHAAHQGAMLLREQLHMSCR